MPKLTIIEQMFCSKASKAYNDNEVSLSLIHQCKGKLAMQVSNNEMIAQSIVSQQKVWIVVKVVAGLPWYVEAYDNEEYAKNRVTDLAKGINIDEDDLGYYEATVNLKSEEIVNLFLNN